MGFFNFLKNRKRKKEIETSVLNTDNFDKRRFKQIMGMSKSMQELEGRTDFPDFENLLGDIWASLFKASPELKNDVEEHLTLNKEIIERLMNEESYQDYRQTTKLDDMVSAIGTIKFGEQTLKWFEEQARENEDLREHLEQIKDLAEQIEQEQDKESQEGENDNEEGQSELEEQMNEVMNDMAEEMFDNAQSLHSFSQAMQNAVEETQETADDVEALVGGKEAGTGSSELNKLPLRDKIKLAEILSNDIKMKEIAKWAGRFKKIARTKQKMKHEDSTEQSGVEMGNDLERVLPSELLLLSDERTRNDFLRRYAEGELMQYEQEGKESLGEGSIIVCLDQSGSMYDLENISKAFTLAIMSIAKRQRRNFVYIPYDNELGEVRTFKKGKIKPKEMIKFAGEFLSGGTDFENPLEESLKYLKKENYKDADIVFITDGEALISEHFLNDFIQDKEKLEFNVLSLALTSSTRTLQKFSDKVIEVDNFDDDGAFEAFEI